MPCPMCKSEKFYVKDPEDQYEVYEFTLKNGNPVFEDTKPEFISSQGHDYEVYCNTCVWHGKINELA